MKTRYRERHPGGELNSKIYQDLGISNTGLVNSHKNFAEIEMNDIIESLFIKIIFSGAILTFLASIFIYLHIPLFFIIIPTAILFISIYLNKLRIQRAHIKDTFDYWPYISENYRNHEKYKVKNDTLIYKLKKKLYRFLYFDKVLKNLFWYFNIWLYIGIGVIILSEFLSIIIPLAFFVFIALSVTSIIKFLKYRKEKIQEINDTRNKFIIANYKSKSLKFTNFKNSEGGTTYIFY